MEESRTRSIVIVEDDEDIADSIRYNLERESFRVRIAATGEAALELILERPPSLVLLDLNLPHMSGFEICRRLRAEATTARLPILILTARTDEADKVLGLNIGADDYITKPFSMRELVARVNAVLRRAEGLEPAPAIFDDGRAELVPCGERLELAEAFAPPHVPPGRTQSNSAIVVNIARLLAAIDSSLDDISRK